MLCQQNPFNTRFQAVKASGYETTNTLSINHLQRQKKQPAERLLFCGQTGETTLNRRDLFYAMLTALTRTTY
jgi:hypothetical protein